MAAEEIPAIEERAERSSERRWSPAQHPRRRSSDTAQSILAGQTVIAVAVVFTICYFAKLVIVVLLVSILFAFILAPLVGLFERLRMPRPVGAFIALLIFLGVIYGGLYFGYSKAVDFSQQLPKYSQEIKHIVMRFRAQAEKIQNTTQGVLAAGSEEKNKQTVTVQQSNWWDSITSGLGTVTEILLMVSFIPFLVYFMLTWQDHVRAATVMLFKMENRNTAYVTLGRISAMIHSFINGNLVVGLFTSIISMIVFGALHVPYFYFLAFISGFLSLVPYLGVVLAMIPPLVAGIGHLHGGGMLVIALTVFGLHVFAINVLYPKLIGKRLQLNPLAVTLALLLWGWLWGAMGLILAIPITGALKIILDHIESLRPYGAWLGE
jgi:predicted PurR-regulated permease PerM